MGFWSDVFGGGNSFSQSVANVFTPNDGKSYSGGTLVKDKPTTSSKPTLVSGPSSTPSTRPNSRPDPIIVSGLENKLVNSDPAVSSSTDYSSSTPTWTNPDTGSTTNWNDSGAMTVTDTGGNPVEVVTETITGKKGDGILSDNLYTKGIEFLADTGSDEHLSAVIDGKYVYTRPDGSQYSYNSLGLPYDVNVQTETNSEGVSVPKVVDATDYTKIDTLIAEGNDDAATVGVLTKLINAADAADIPLTEDTILAMAEKVGMDESNEELKALINDPLDYMGRTGMLLSDNVPTLDADAAGANIDPTDPKFLLGDSPTVTPNLVTDTSQASMLNQTAPATYTAATVSDQLGTPETTVDAATGTIDDNNLVDADAVQIDMTGVATGVNEDGSVNELGVAVNDYATQNFTNIIDTSTADGKLLAAALGEGNYTDAKTTIMGQAAIIEKHFKNDKGEAIIPATHAATARAVSKTIAFDGIAGTASTAMMANALMETTLGIAEKEASFFQNLTFKNLDNRQAAILNKATVLSNISVANLGVREAAAVANANAFLTLDIKNLDNEQQAEIINKQEAIDALFQDQTAENAARLFTAEATNEMQTFYDNLNAQIDLKNTEEINAMKRFNAGELTDAAEFNASMEDSRQKFYSEMQFNIDKANAAWRQTVELTQTEMEFDAASEDIKNSLDLSQEALNRLWDRVDNMLDYVFKGWNAEADRDATILGAQIQAQADQEGGNSIMSTLLNIGGTYLTNKWASSDERLKSNIEYLDTLKGIKFYQWVWNDEAKRLGFDQYPPLGVIAQDIQKKHPDAVKEGPEGYLMVNYGALEGAM
jgi:hypothetical protein